MLPQNNAKKEKFHNIHLIEFSSDKRCIMLLKREMIKKKQKLLSDSFPSEADNITDFYKLKIFSMQNQESFHYVE